MLEKRYLNSTISEFLEEKMVFLGGPRQVGKTSLCLQFLPKQDRKSLHYLNWDNPEVRPSLRSGKLPGDANLVVIDEIHKYRHWRGLLKGMFDTYRDECKILVTGSARLDHYRRGGDSLMGRYHYLRLHPYSLGELKVYTASDMQHLLTFGGFPEPFLKGNAKKLRIWQNQRLFQIIRDDVRDLENIKEISLLETLAEELANRAGSIISNLNLAQDLGVHHATISHWLQILDNLYFSFRIPPYGPPKIKTVKKEQKLYLWDWSTIPEMGHRFENMVASQLLKYCHFLQDTEGHKMELRFLKDTQKREVDFVVIKNKLPLFAVECKASDRAISPHLHYFSERTHIPHFYQVHLGQTHVKLSAKVTSIPFSRFVKDLKLN